MALDLLLNEDGNGGDIVFSGSDLKVIDSVQNIVYLSLFGGSEWWGNDVFFKDLPDKQYRCLTEKTLDEVPLNSSGRIAIENAIKEDLRILNNYGSYTVTVSILSDDVILIDIKMIINSNDNIVQLRITKNSDGDFVFEDFNDDFLV